MTQAALARPADFSYRDALCGVLAVAAIRLKLPAAFDLAAKACEPLFSEYPPDPKRWSPSISAEHARAAVICARHAQAEGAITQDEFTWICDKVRRAILHGLPTRQAEFAEPS